MTRAGLVSTVLVGLWVSGCTDNEAPGNDREAGLSSPEPPAELAPAGAAIEGVVTGLLQPQVFTDADLRNVPEVGDRCIFSFTRVGLPILVYGSTAVLKLNGKAVALPAAGDGEYAADGVTLTLRPLEDDPGAGELFSSELVLRLPGADHELGYHGYSRCGEGAPAG